MKTDPKHPPYMYSFMPAPVPLPDELHVQCCVVHVLAFVTGIAGSSILPLAVPTLQGVGCRQDTLERTGTFRPALGVAGQIETLDSAYLSQEGKLIAASASTSSVRIGKGVPRNPCEMHILYMYCTCINTNYNMNRALRADFRASASCTR